MAVHVDPTGKERLGGLAPAVEEAIGDLVGRNAVKRIWDGDHTLWQHDPTEVADRLGWLHVIHDMFGEVTELEDFAADCRAEGFTDCVVLGMGGSSLFAEVIARTFHHHHNDGLHLHVLDTTDPGAIARLVHALPLDRTLFLASSKSGTTIEARSHLAYFFDVVGNPSQFIAITDAGTPLASLAAELDFRAVFGTRDDIGGRYSALSYFGLLPAVLAGVDIRHLLESALAMAGALRPSESDAETYDHPGVRLAAIMGAAVREGRDKLTLIVDPEVDSFGLWLEQLIAESTGKAGTGVVPVVNEPLGDAPAYGHDRLFVSIGWHPALDGLAGAGHPVVELPHHGRLALGAHVLLWEFAVALGGAVLGINPFDQPNVAEAKDATNRVLAAGALPTIDEEPLGNLLDVVEPGDYLAIQAYVDPRREVVVELERARVRLRDELGVATTMGLGPRFLHSTGQLHKGGPPTGVFVQVVGDDLEDVHIPGESYTFSTLKAAQAAGDLATLRRHGRRAARVALDELRGMAR